MKQQFVNLATEYRPTCFKDVVGQDLAVSALKRIAHSPGIACRSIFLKGAYGSGKCVPRGTRVLTKDGYLKIESLFDNPTIGFNNFNTSVLTRKGFKPTSHFYYEKDADVITLHLSNGSIIRGTAKHRIMSKVGSTTALIPIGDLGVGSKVLLSNEVLEYGKDYEHAYLLGALLGDGGRFKGNYYFSGTYDMCSKIARLAGWYGAIVKDKRRKDLYTVRPLKSDVIKVELPFESNSHNKTLPEFCYNMSVKSRYELLQGLLDTDGSLSKDFEITMASKELIYSLYDICLTLGMVGRLSVKVVKGNTYYRLRILKSELGDFVFSKNGKVLQSTSSKNNRKLIEITDSEIDQILMTRLLHEHYEGDYIYRACSNFKSYHRATQRTLEKISSLIGLPESLREAIKYTHLEVVGVSHTKEDVYDLSVPEVHEFYAQGTYNHNTTMSKIFGKALNCSNFEKTDDVCNSCEGCQESSRKNSQLYYEFDASVVGNVEGIATIKSILEVVPNGRRLIVFDEAHSCSKAALNQLLKMLEEGIQDTMFLFASTEDILETIKSRSICIDISTIPQVDLIRRLRFVAEDRHISISDNQLNLIALKSHGHMRNALSILQYFEMCGERALDTSFMRVKSFLIKALSKSKHAEAEAEIEGILKYPVVDIRDSINTVIKSIYTAAPNTLEDKVLKSGACDKLFNFFYSPIAVQAIKTEAGMELLLRSFYEKTTPKS